MIEELTKEIDGKSYILSKFPAIAGREIIAMYPASGMPKIGDYKSNEATMLKLMAYVQVVTDNGTKLALTNSVLVNNHVPSWETLAKLELAMLEYNCSFFQSGRISTFFEDIAQKAPAWISKMLTTLSEQSSQTEKQPSTNSEQSIV